jgi:hypothetical protein
VTRKLHLAPHFSSAEVRRRYQPIMDPVESRRWHLLWLASDQTSLTDAARVVGLNYCPANQTEVPSQEGLSLVADAISFDVG